MCAVVGLFLLFLSSSRCRRPSCPCVGVVVFVWVCLRLRVCLSVGGRLRCSGVLLVWGVCLLLGVWLVCLREASLLLAVRRYSDGLVLCLRHVRLFACTFLC